MHLRSAFLRGLLLISISCICLVFSLKPRRLGKAFRRRKRIVFGDKLDVTESFVVGLYIGDEGICSGALVAKRWIATALHCVAEVKYETKTDIVGYYETKLSDYLQDATIKWQKPSSITVLNTEGEEFPNAVEHIEKFNVDATILRGHYEMLMMRRSLPEIDIVLLRLKSKWYGRDAVKTITLPHPRRMPEPNLNQNIRSCHVAGFGCSEVFRRYELDKEGFRQREQCSARCNTATKKAARADVDVDDDTKCAERLKNTAISLGVDIKGDNYISTMMCWTGKPLIGQNEEIAGIGSRCASGSGDSGGPMYCGVGEKNDPVLFALLSMSAANMLQVTDTQGNVNTLYSVLGEYEHGVRMTEFVKWVQYTIHDYRDRLLKKSVFEQIAIKAENTVQVMCCGKDLGRNKCSVCELT